METKTCRACRCEKPLTEFWLRDKAVGTRHAQCIACTRKKRSTPEALANQRIAEQRRYAENPQKVLEKNRRWIQRNLEKHNARTKKWRLANPQKHRQSSKAWAAANADKMREWQSMHYANNKAKCRALIRAWHNANRERLKPISAMRAATKRSRKLQATPAWANEFFIGEAYHLASLRKEICGGDWHVDHIVPIRSKLVCGLHVESNLRVIPADENLRKSNRHWPDMP